jgi:uncharacterized glyoxalase superfamily protein PhnB
MKSTIARLARIAPELPVRNLKTALEFYTRQLGFEVAATMPDGAYAIVKRDGVAIHLFEDKAGDLTPVGVHIFTPDLEELCNEFEDRRAHFVQKIERKPWGTRDFRLKDAFGNELKFTEPQADD